MSIAHEVNQPMSDMVINAGTCLRLPRSSLRSALRSRPLDLNEIAREAIAASLGELRRNRVTLQLELAYDLPLVLGDRVQLHQVILNLLRNASDATSAVHDRPRQLVIRTELDKEGCVRLSVQDVGVGFEPQAADRLFEAFYTTKDEGMGIGLSVCRSIVDRHHGWLWATPNDGRGVTFSFTIPQGLRVLRVPMFRNLLAAEAQRFWYGWKM